MILEYLVITLVAFIGSGLTLFSGFGLGTILTPVFAIFFPIEIAITLTAIVHFLNNVFKLFLVGNNAHKKTIIRFGIPSIVAALLGAYILNKIGDAKPLLEYTLYNKHLVISPVKFTIAILMLVFTFIDFIPSLKNTEIHPKYLPLGGVLSGFFGGLSGNQGALRTMFLIKSNLTKESFIATGVVLACIIDITRLSLYSKKIIEHATQLNIYLVCAATMAAFLGAYLGNKLLKKVTIHLIQNIVAIMLILFSILLGLGII
jgi:uncharacterized protein